MDLEDVSCNVLNMEFFDRLWVKGLINDMGEMAKSKPDSWGDIPCADEVRKVGIIMCLWCMQIQKGRIHNCYGQANQALQIIRRFSLI